MRGIGKGQTICLFVIPEIDEKIRAQVSVGSGRPVDRVRSESQYLKDVLSWLSINRHVPIFSYTDNITLYNTSY